MRNRYLGRASRFRAQHRTMLAPALRILDRLYATTVGRAGPSTPHESWFTTVQRAARDCLLPFLRCPCESRISTSRVRSFRAGLARPCCPFKNFGGAIAAAIATLRQPAAAATALEPWQPFRTLIAELAKVLGKRQHKPMVRRPRSRRAASPARPAHDGSLRRGRRWSAHFSAWRSFRQCSRRLRSNTFKFRVAAAPP